MQIPNIIQSVTDKQYELICPICHGQMNLGESDKGGLYWKCSNCDYGRDLKQQYPVDGILRCQCGGLYRFAMKNQPRWACTNNPKHYHIVKKGDLRLKKMAALIPTNRERNAVDAYFESKKKNRPEKKNGSTSNKEKEPDTPEEEVKQLTFEDLGLI